MTEVQDPVRTAITYTDQMKVDLIDSMASDDAILRAMMVSTDGDGTVEEMTPEAKAGRINFLMANRHGSPFEHGSITFRVEAPIAVFREWHRHRVQSFNEMSGRYTVLPPKFYIPAPERPLVQQGKPGHYEFVPGNAEQYRLMYTGIERQCRNAYGEYEAMMEAGIAKEVARGVLPVYTFSVMYVTANPRAWMHFLSLRTKDEDSMFPSFPMWEIEQCADKVEAALHHLMPLTMTAFGANRRVAP